MYDDKAVDSMATTDKELSKRRTSASSVEIRWKHVSLRDGILTLETREFERRNSY